MEIKDHICERTQDALRQQSVSHYCKVHVRRTSEATFLYLWKPVDDKGFRIDFCPFCGTPAENIIRQMFPIFASVSFHLMFIDVPLRNRSCVKCHGTEFRELTNTTLPLSICMTCNRIGTLL